MTWLNIDSEGGIVGLSEGDGALSDFIESDLSGYEECSSISDGLWITPFDVFIATGPAGGSFDSTNTTFTLTNMNASALNWSVTSTATWLSASSTGGTLAAYSTTNVNFSLNTNAYTLDKGIYNQRLVFSNTTSGTTHTRWASIHAGIDYLMESFNNGSTEPSLSSSNDLAYTTYTFTPDGSVNYYSVCQTPATGYLTDISSATALSFDDYEGYYKASLTGEEKVSLFGTDYDSFYILANGQLIFGDDYARVDDEDDFSNFFAAPHICFFTVWYYSPLYGDFSWEQRSDRVAVTYNNVVSYYGYTNRFQIELFYNGKIRCTGLNIDEAEGLIGLSQGTGRSEFFTQSDFSAYDTCTVVTDTDGDGIPDIWENSHGLNFNDASDALLDGDSDLFINLEEYIANTDPADGTSYLYIDQVSYQTNQVTVNFASSTGRLYSLECSTNPASDAWKGSCRSRADSSICDRTNRGKLRL